MQRLFGCLLVAASSVVALEARATTYQVGSSRTYKQLSAVASLLAPGDRVEVDGNATYTNVTFTKAGTAAAPITIIGVPVSGQRPVISGGTNTVAFTSPAPYTSGADHYVFQGFEVTGGSSRCIYHQAGDLTLRDLVVHDCPSQGILGADGGSGSLLLEYSEVYRCGSGTQSHQIYMSTDEANRPGSVFRMQFNYVHDGNGGNNVKSRAERNEIYYNWIEGAAYHELELIGCDGDAGCSESTAREDSDVVGNVLVKRSDFYVVRFGGDKTTGQSWGRFHFANNTVVGLSTAVFRLFLGLESVQADNNVFYRASGSPNLAPLTDAVWLTGSPVLVGTNNWAKSGASNVPAGFTATVTGSDPKFTNLAGNDLMPAAGSPLLGAGAVSPGDLTGGHAVANILPRPLYLPPTHAALAPGSTLGRAASGPLTIGALDTAASGSAPEAPSGLAGQVY